MQCTQFLLYEKDTVITEGYRKGRLNFSHFILAHEPLVPAARHKYCGLNTSRLLTKRPYVTDLKQLSPRLYSHDPYIIKTTTNPVSFQLPQEEIPSVWVNENDGCSYFSNSTRDLTVHDQIYSSLPSISSTPIINSFSLASPIITVLFNEMLFLVLQN